MGILLKNLNISDKAYECLMGLEDTYILSHKSQKDSIYDRIFYKKYYCISICYQTSLSSILYFPSELCGFHDFTPLNFRKMPIVKQVKNRAVDVLLENSRYRRQRYPIRKILDLRINRFRQSRN